MPRAIYIVPKIPLLLSFISITNFRDKLFALFVILSFFYSNISCKSFLVQKRLKQMKVPYFDSSKETEMTCDKMEFPKTMYLQDSLRHMFSEAIILACGKEYVSVLSQTGGSVRACNKWQTAGDFQSACAHGIFNKHVGQKKRRSRSLLQEASCMKVITFSEFGNTMEREYHNPRDVAEGIISCLEEEKRYALISDIRINGEDGVIVLTTKPHFDWHTIMGRKPCLQCGRFFKGTRGVRIHQMVDHKIAYEHAQRQVFDMEHQIVKYSADRGILQQWRQQAQELIVEKNKLGDNGLEASKNGDLATLKELVSSGWDPHTTVDKHGSTALMWAAGEGHLQICTFLVDVCGVDVNHLAGQAKRRRHALHWAARNGHTRICEWLVCTKNVDVDVGTDDGTTPLHYSVWMGQIQTTKWLVESAQSNVNKLNSYGCNASQWCALKGDVDMMKYLRSQGLNLHILNKNGHSALHKAAMKGRDRACFWLLESEQNGGGGLTLQHMQQDRDGSTPSSLAFANGYDELGVWLNNVQLLCNTNVNLTKPEC